MLVRIMLVQIMLVQIMLVQIALVQIVVCQIIASRIIVICKIVVRLDHTSKPGVSSAASMKAAESTASRFPVATDS
jgi:hypothetical protein